jgi:hypothetical protein
MQVSWATEAGSPRRPNEDFGAAAPGAVVLLDGVSLDAHIETGCGHGRPWFVRRLGTRLLGALGEDWPIGEALSVAIKGVVAAHGGKCDLRHPCTPASTVVALRLRGPVVEYLVMSDSTLLLDVDGTISAVTEDFGAVAAASPEVAARATVGSVPADRLSRAALLTDGATRLVEAFRLSNWAETMDTLQHNGPAALIEAVRAAENTDPEGRRWPRHKIHDDAAAAICLF